MYDVPALEMYINYDKTTHNPIERVWVLGSSHILSTLSHSVLLVTAHMLQTLIIAQQTKAWSPF